jgi:predicted protein tyrosine phosphatase
MNVLFICSANVLRSPTAEAVFAGYPGVETDSAGTATDAEMPVSADAIEWADIIFVMEDVHKRRLQRMFSLKDKRLIVLGIPDDYEYMDPKLVEILKRKVEPFLRDAASRS